MSDETKVCARCGTRYHEDYDACPACAKREESAKFWRTLIIVLVAIGLLMCCIQPELFTAFMRGLRGAS